jgi:hypothetical protein
MNVSTLRNQLHQYLETASDKKVKAIYTIFESDLKNSIDFTQDLKNELDMRHASYLDGSAIMFTAEESKAKINSILSKAKGI